MTRRGCVALLVALALTAPLAAQSRGSKAKAADPITGTWKGEILLTGAPRGRPVTLELKHDGKGAVSGTVTGLPNPADVKAGAFDPKTGALKLQLGKQGEAGVLLVFEGTVAKNTASGRVNGDATGDFKLTRADTK